MRTYWIAVIPGDGIGQEVIPKGIQVLKALTERNRDFALAFEFLPWGTNYYRATDRFMPENGIAMLQQYDAIYLGAVGDLEIPDHVTLWSWWLPVFRALDQYAKILPLRILPNIRVPLLNCGPSDLDWVIVHANGERASAGDSGRPYRDTASFSSAGVFQIMRFAFELARSRPRRQLTVVTQSGAEPVGMETWRRVGVAIMHESPDVTVDTEAVDTMASRMVLRPQSLDTIIATGAHADILECLGVALAGGRGIVPSANICPSGRFPSMFSPSHGPAYDIRGKGFANPIAAFWTGALMIEHLGERDAAARLMAAIERVTAAGAPLTRDLGGTATTRAVTDAVIAAVRGSNA
jgi:tartrate dehydrogenase/decarboxylase/D-malate dehydrogenase